MITDEPSENGSQIDIETPDEHSETEIIIAESHEDAEAHVKVSTKYGNADTRLGLKDFIRRLTSVKTANQLNCFLNTMGLFVKNGAGRGKIPCQPTSVARRPPGMPRGAAALGK